MDFILNGQANGDVASTLLHNGFDANALRPWIGQDGRSYVTVNDRSGKPVPQLVGNAQATLRKDDWILLDTAIVKAAKPRLRFVGDLRSAGLTYSIPQGMGKTVLETETMGDISPAEIHMDGLSRSREDRPQFEISSLPLPIIHKDFSFSARQVMTSRNGGSPIDTSTAELAGRRVAETAEQLAIGSLANYKYGGGNVYGMINFPGRATHVITAPDASGWTGKQLVLDILAMRKKSTDMFHFGPWRAYVGPAWDEYLDQDYSDAKGDNTLRERVEAINGINGVTTLDYIEGFQIVLVQQTNDVIREVIGMDITTLQWPSHGGLQLNFKVMAILVPQLRADQNGNTGIVHGSPA